MNTKILLIDDDPTLLNLLSLYLRESDFEVFEASNGDERIDRSASFERYPQSLHKTQIRVNGSIFLNP